MADTNITPRDSYLERTAKLIPAEALALFVPTSNWIAASGMPQERKEHFILAWAAVVGLVAVPTILRKVHNVQPGKQYLIACVAFALWVFNVQYTSLPIPWGDHETAIVLGSVLMATFTFIVPFFVTGKEA